MIGIELDASIRTGDDGLELAGVIGVETTSLPTPPLSMAESSTNRNFLLLGSTNKKNVLESDEKRNKKKREEKEEPTSIVAREEKSPSPWNDAEGVEEPERSEGEVGDRYCAWGADWMR